MFKVADKGITSVVEKKRYLLFDSGCSECTEIAHAVEQETEGWLTARSLHEPEVQELLSKARPDWKWEPTLLEVDRDKITASTGFNLKTRMLIGLGPRKAARVSKIVRRESTQDLEITFVPSQKDPERYIIESVKPIDRITALKTLGTLGLAVALLPILPDSVLARAAYKGTANTMNSAARVRRVELTARQALNVFNSVRKQDPNVRKLVASLDGKDFDLIGAQAQGMIVRMYAANGTAQGGDIILRLPYRKANGQRAQFGIVVRGGTAGGGQAQPGRVKADYTVLSGKQLLAYAVRNGQVRLVQQINNYETYNPRSSRTVGAQVDSYSFAAQDDLTCSECTDISNVLYTFTCTTVATLATFYVCVRRGAGGLTCSLAAAYLWWAICDWYVDYSVERICGSDTGGPC